jgi:hypothetical protein
MTLPAQTMRQIDKKLIYGNEKLPPRNLSN